MGDDQVAMAILFVVQEVVMSKSSVDTIGEGVGWELVKVGRPFEPFDSQSMSPMDKNP